MTANTSSARLEKFTNAGYLCIVLARTGDTALIVMPTKEAYQFVVPLQHRKGEADWWQGRYFDNLAEAWACYIEAVGR